MGRSGRKLQRKQNQINNNKKTDQNKLNPPDLSIILDEIHNYKEQGKYNEALEAVIRSFENYGVQPVTAFETAEVYYLSGDYERSALWCENTLKLDPCYIGVFILLARLAILRDQLDNALALMNRVCNILNSQVDSWRGQLQELLDLILIDYEAKLVSEKYPVLWRCIHENSELQISESTDEVLEKNLDIEKYEIVSSPELEIEKRTDDGNTEKLQAEIMARPISLKEKALLCNEAAVQFYHEDKLKFALSMLKLGLAIDGTDELTIRNTGFLLLKMGNAAEAKECLLRLKTPDLMVLDAIQ